MTKDTNKKIIVLTGGTGFIGSALTVALLQRGYRVRILTRDKKKYDSKKTLPVEYFSWDSSSEIAPREALENSFGVIHLSGEPVAGSRWTAKRKKEILESRTVGTQNLIRSIQALQEKPEVLVGTSAIGFYGDRKDEELTESSALGAGFLPDVCKQWEEETFKASAFMRVPVIRVGIVLGTQSGALAEMLPIFRLGLGGPLGSGAQWMSWIHLEDLVQMYIFALENKVDGLLNGVAPNPVTNKTFTKALSESLGRPALFPAPKPAIRMAFGEMSSIIFSSQKVLPQRALKLKFKFQFPEIHQALGDLLSPLGIKGAYTLNEYQWIPESKAKVFEFFSQATNLELLTPSWLNFKIKKMSDEKIQKNTLIDYQISIRGIPVGWKTLIEEWNPENSFVDRSLKGPYRDWHHTHTFTELDGGTLIQDRVIYRLPVGVLGNLVASVWVKGDVTKIFNFRKQKISEIFGNQK